ncbi:hypothetical protein LSPH24S_04996 [Lysinibacillus sphaericus]
MIERLHFIEKRKQEGLSLVEIQQALNVTTTYEEIDVQKTKPPKKSPKPTPPPQKKKKKKRREKKKEKKKKGGQKEKKETKKRKKKREKKEKKENVVEFQAVKFCRGVRYRR